MEHLDFSEENLVVDASDIEVFEIEDIDDATGPNASVLSCSSAASCASLSCCDPG